MDSKWKKLYEKLKNPSGIILTISYVLTILFCAGAVLAVVTSENAKNISIFSYPLFAFAAIFLAYSTYTVVVFGPSIKNKLIVFLKKHKFTRNLLENYGFRTVVFATLSTSLNVLYVIFNGVVAIISRSIWYGSLAGYYIVITALRLSIISYHKEKRSQSDDASIHEQSQDESKEVKKYKACGVFLLVLPLCLSASITEMVVNNSGFIYWGWTVFAFAAYAFYKITMSIFNVVKARKNDDITLQALRNIGLADAFVSILALQTALLYAYAEGTDYAFANAITGAVVCASTVVIGTLMIIRANKLMKKRGIYGK